MFISLNDRLQHISELNIEYIDMLKVDPTLSKKCFNSERYKN
ncbi:hypothetical protein [Staphylococcus saprophyticus]|nr:hypothetical protein [Staphylococcus saprophyticus]